MLFFFFKQKTAYEMRISDSSSDVCSSDLDVDAGERATQKGDLVAHVLHGVAGCLDDADAQLIGDLQQRPGQGDRKSVVSGKSVSVRVDLGGRRIINKKKRHLKPTPNYTYITSNIKIKHTYTSMRLI